MQLGGCVVSACEVTGWKLGVWNSRAVISMCWDKVARRLMCAEATVWSFQVSGRLCCEFSVPGWSWVGVLNFRCFECDFSCAEAGRAEVPRILELGFRYYTNFEGYLSVCKASGGESLVPEAVRRVWWTARTNRERSYKKRSGLAGINEVKPKYKGNPKPQLRSCGEMHASQSIACILQCRSDTNRHHVLPKGFVQIFQRPGGIWWL